MRESIASVALIPSTNGDGTSWLARWNEHWNTFNLVAGHKRRNETFRECVARELAEELGLYEPHDLAIAEEALACVRFVAWSKRAQVETAYTMQLFPVCLNSDDARAGLERNSDCRWLNEQEIRAQRTTDGRPVSDVAERLLDAVHWRIEP